MSGSASIAQAAWLKSESLQRLLAILSDDGEEARIAGGAVRNALLGAPPGDIDIATTVLPEETMRRVVEAGFRAVPTGIGHGTVTVLASGAAYEVTTLRADVETDGRHARVAFGRDWTVDAQRRDFTINGLFARADGQIVDHVGGLADLEARMIRFIGDPDRRIREDYLRILRFFRFFAFYGSGRPDAAGLKACARLKDGLERLSAERVWSELRKLLSAPDPTRALLWMRQAGVLTAILPESEKWGIDAIHGLVAAERDLGWAADPLLRLAAIVPPDAPRMKGLAERLRLSNAERERLLGWASASATRPAETRAGLRARLYRDGGGGIVDRLRLETAAARAKASPTDMGSIAASAHLLDLLDYASAWSRPQLPVSGADLEAAGMVRGPEIGARLKMLEAEWVASDFGLTRAQLLARLPARPA